MLIATLCMWATQYPDGSIWPRCYPYYICASHDRVGVGAPFGRGMWGIFAWLATALFAFMPAISVAVELRRPVKRRGFDVSPMHRT